MLIHYIGHLWTHTAALENQLAQRGIEVSPQLDPWGPEMEADIEGIVELIVQAAKDE